MRRAGFATTAILALTIAGCGEGIGDGITDSSAALTPTPAPAATPTPTAALMSCTLPPQLPNCDSTCCSEGGEVIYRAEIEASQADLRQNQPDLFFGNGDVKNNFEFLGALAKRLEEMHGLCAEPLAHDEMRVKGDQNVSQHVDVLIADVTPWVGGAYTCRPASF